MESQLKRIQDKLQQLLKQHATLQKENLQLKEQLTDSIKKSAEEQRVVEELKQQVDVLRINTGSMNDRDKKELEKKINAYLKEIDRCIALLGE